jgi:ABC-type uncharacterized transport system auxiliary subunit
MATRLSSEDKEMRNRAIGCFFLLVTVLCGCASVPAPKYYRVPLDLSALDSALFRTYSESIRVAAFRAAAPLRQDSIVTYRDDCPVIEFSDNCLWESSPPSLIRQKLTEAFRACSLFNRVESQPGRPPTNYVLRGQILRFNHLQTSDGSYGEVGLAVEFVSHEDHEILWSTIVRVREKAQSDSPEAVVLAVSKALHHCILQIVQQVNHATAFRSSIR